MGTTTRKSPMDLDHFLDELKLVSDYFSWEHQQDWPVTVRGCHRNGDTYCPLTAVAFVTLGLNYTIEQWPAAAIALGVPDDVASDIMVAADGGVVQFAEYDMLYESLLDAVGLNN